MKKVCVRARPEWPPVPILVVVATIRMRPWKADVDEGSYAGELILNPASRRGERESGQYS